MLIDHNQLFWVAERQRLEQHCAHDGEERCGGADTESHNKDGGESEARRAGEGACTISYVTREFLEPVPAPGGAGFIAEKRWIAECTQGCRTRLVPSHTMGDVLCDLLLQVKLQFVVQPRCFALAPEQH